MLMGRVERRWRLVGRLKDYPGLAASVLCRQLLGDGMGERMDVRPW